MSDEVTVKVSAITEEFIGAENYWKARAITLANTVDQLRARIAELEEELPKEEESPTVE